MAGFGLKNAEWVNLFKQAVLGAGFILFILAFGKLASVLYNLRV